MRKLLIGLAFVPLFLAGAAAGSHEGLDYWLHCTGSPQTCVEEAAPTVTVTVTEPSPVPPPPPPPPPPPEPICHIEANPGVGTAQVAINAATSGQTVCLHGGVYTPSSSTTPVLNFPRGGAAGSPIVVKSYPGERATLQNLTNTQVGTDLVAISNSVNFLTLENLNLVGPTNGFSIHSQGDDIIFDGLDVDGRGGIGTNTGSFTCVLLGSHSAGPSINNVVTHSTIHNCGQRTFRSCCNVGGNEDHAIYIANGAGNTIRRNLIHDIQAYTIQLYPQSMGTLVEFNTVDGGPNTIRGGVVIGGETNFPQVSSNNLVKDNILVGAVTAQINGCCSRAGTNNVVRDNCLWPAPGAVLFAGTSHYTQSNNLNVDPQFVDRAAHNYNLQPGSPCVGKGRY